MTQVSVISLNGWRFREGEYVCDSYSLGAYFSFQWVFLNLTHRLAAAHVVSSDARRCFGGEAAAVEG